jgi:hypothetical protein
MGGASSVSMPPSTSVQLFASHTSDLGSRDEGHEPGPRRNLAVRGRELERVCRRGFPLKMDRYSRETKPDDPLVFSRHNLGIKL